jgi:hypothetical protein
LSGSLATFRRDSAISSTAQATTLTSVPIATKRFQKLLSKSLIARPHPVEVARPARNGDGCADGSQTDHAGEDHGTTPRSSRCAGS